MRVVVFTATALALIGCAVASSPRKPAPSVARATPLTCQEPPAGPPPLPPVRSIERVLAWATAVEDARVETVRALRDCAEKLVRMQTNQEHHR